MPSGKRSASGNAGELLKLSGIRNPYPGDLCIVKEGAFADLLLVDGNPLEELYIFDLMTKPNVTQRQQD